MSINTFYSDIKWFKYRVVLEYAGYLFKDLAYLSHPLDYGFILLISLIAWPL